MVLNILQKNVSINLNLAHLHLDMLTSMILDFISRTLDNSQLVQVLPNIMFLMWIRIAFVHIPTTHVKNNIPLLWNAKELIAN